MRVLVCGGRNFRDVAFLEKKLDELHEVYNFSLVIHGDARGADMLSMMWAEKRDIPWWGFPAQWITFGLKAGFRRNTEMLEVGKPELVIAFEGGNGTADTTFKALSAHLKVIKISRHNERMKTRSAAKTEKKKVVAETSEKFKEALAEGGVEHHYDFPSANKSKLKPVRDDLNQIVQVVFISDMKKTWDRLREGLSVGDNRSEHGTLQKALDLAEKRAYDAHRLYITAKVEYQRWERENEVFFGALWSKANRDLQTEKDAGSRSKQITDADVKARIATMFPDEYQLQENKRSQVKATVDSLEDLAEEWKSRCRTLQVMMGKLRG